MSDKETQNAHYDKDVFLKELANFRDRKHAYALQLDKSLLAFSTSALGLSVTLAVKLFDKPIWTTCLVMSWCWLLGSVGFTLAGYRFAQDSYADSEEGLIEAYIREEMPRPSKFKKEVEYCSYGGAACFVMGLVFLSIFVGINLYKGP